MRSVRAMNQRVLDLFIVNPSSGQSLAYMDGVRAVAVLFVLLTHAWIHGASPRVAFTLPLLNRTLDLTSFFPYMSVGVDLFFVLSGFLLAQHWLRADYLGKPRPSLRTYFRQRAFRIVPAYYVCLFLTLVLLAPIYIPVYLVTGPFGRASVLAHFAFLHYAFPFSAGSFGVDAPFWTLTIEVMFYVTLPWVVRLFFRNRWWLALPLALVANVAWLVLCKHSLGWLVTAYQTHLNPAQADAASIRYILSYQYPGHFFHFALGITLANLYVRRQLGLPAGRIVGALTSKWAGTASFFIGWEIVIAGMYLLNHYASRLGYRFDRYATESAGWWPYYLHGIPFAFGFTLIIVGVLFGAGWLRTLFSFTPLRIIGVLGYSIYLWHFAVLTVLSKLPGIAALAPPHRFPALLVAGTAVLLVLCSGTYLAVEKPFMLLGRAPAGRRAAALSVAHAAGMGTAAQVPAAPAAPAERGILCFFAVPSSAGTKVGYLDGIRAIAVIFVLVRHCWVLAGAPEIVVTNFVNKEPVRLTTYFAGTFVGVDLFFVLSGFLLAQYWLQADFLHRPRPSLRRYLRHRIFRIVPAYYVCLFLMLLFLVPYLISSAFVYSRVGAFMLAAHLSFTQYLFPLSAADYVVNGSLWTLTIEMIFYLVLPWAVVLFLRNRWIVTLPALTLLTLGWLYLCRHSLGPYVHLMQGTVAQYNVDERSIRAFLAQQFPAYFVNFGLGMVVANLLWQYKTKGPAYRVLQYVTVPWMAAVYCGVGWIIVLSSMNRVGPEIGNFAYYLKDISVAVGFTLILAGVIAGGEVLQMLYSLPPLRFIGIIGYSVFLWHMPLIYLITKYPGIAALPPDQRFPHVLFLTTIASLLLGTLSYLFVEKPFILRGRRQALGEALPVTYSASDSAALRAPEGAPIPATSD